MDFTTLLKGATDTLKKLETDVKTTNVVSNDPSQSGWQQWATPDDDWEDVADVNQPPPNKPPVDTADPKTSTTQTSDVEKKLSEALLKLSATERKLFAVTKDRDALRRTRDQRSGDAELVKEKDKQIKAVLDEGEKLSIKIAEKENTIRSLKSSVKEKDATVEDLRLQLSATEAKVQAAMSRQRQLETAEKSATDAAAAAEKRLRQVESEARSNSSSSAALEAARAQLESLRKSHAAALENQSMRLSADHEAAVEKLKKTAQTNEDSLNKAIMELRAHLSQVLENSGWREDQLRKETDQLRKRAEQLEARNEELAAALPDATRPLLRQVEALQAAATERVRAKSAVDKSQLERLRAAEAELAMAAERERAAEDRIGSLMTKIAGLEEQIKLSQAEHARLASEIRKLQTQEAEVQLRHQRELENLQSQILKATRDRETVSEDLSRERTVHLDAAEAAEERERQLRSQLAAAETKLEMLKETVAKSQGVGRSSSSQTSPGLPRFNSLGNVSNSSLGFASDFGDDEPGTPLGGIYTTERLQQSLRQRNGEIVSLQAKLDGKEAATKALAEEVVSLTAKVEELSKDMQDAPERKKEFDELKRRHTTLLELLGEREERIMELEADLSDVNQMYKEQITELLLRIEKISS